MKYLRIISAMNIYAEGESPIFGWSATRIEVHDEAAGWFFKISQVKTGDDGNCIAVDLEELREILTACEEMAKQERALRQVLP